MLPSTGCARYLSWLLLAVAPVALQAQPAAPFAPGGQELVLLDFSKLPLGAVPVSPRPGQCQPGIPVCDVKGELEIVTHNGAPMLRASGRSSFIVTLPQRLPSDFTLEFDLIPKTCCQPEDLAFEGTREITQSSASANVLWHHYSHAIVGGVVNAGFSTPMPEKLRVVVLGSLTNIAFSFRGPTMTMYTNGEQVYSVDRDFARGSVLRVFLGGQNDTDRAVYLARLRIATGAPAVTPVSVAVAPPSTFPVAAPPVLPPAAIAPPVVAPPIAIPPAVAAPTTPGSRPGSAAPVTNPLLGGDLLVGVGMSDITGPIGEVVMMGFANDKQKTAGLHTRLFARAFVFANRTSNKRVVWVSTELAMLFSSVKQGVLKKLAARYGTMYTDENVMLSATHTHAGPGGYSHHTIYNISIGGFVRQNYDAIVDGITEAIEQAHNRLQPGSVSMVSRDLIDETMVNRSKVAFMLNPEALAVPPVAEINRDMAVLKIISGGKPTGAIAFHAVHNTSMPVTNRLVSSDHKGYAAHLMERAFGSIAPLQSYGAFVAAFPNGAEGDMSPNLNTSAGNAYYGPDPNSLVSSQIIGTRQFNAAFGLFNAVQQTDLGTQVDFRHKTVLMPGTVVSSSSYAGGANPKILCAGAYGMSFMAGAEDGPTGNLSEGLAYGSNVDKAAVDAAKVFAVAFLGALMPAVAPVLGPLAPTAAAAGGTATAAAAAMMTATTDPCQYPKPILLPTGFMHWSPEILPFQIFRIGSVAIAGIPSEMTMQAGRRLEAAIRAVLLPLGVDRVLLTGLANEYSGYVTTPEEYGSQQYEGASTLYGRFTFDAYRETFQQLGVAMASGTPVSGGPPIPDVGAAQIEWKPSIDQDSVAPGESFGQFLLQPPPVVSRGTTVRTVHRSGNPRNDLRRNDSYFRIERDTGGSSWALVAWDNQPETVVQWARDITKCPYCSTMDVFWTVPQSATPGTYRIRVFGSWKNVNGLITTYERSSLSFTVQ